jgi:hypothetical protein
MTPLVYGNKSVLDRHITGKEIPAVGIATEAMQQNYRNSI